MDDYKSNSHKSKENVTESIPAKRIGKVVLGDAKTHKKNGIQRFAEALIAEDFGDIRSYIWSDVLKPAIKKAIHDAVTGGVQMMLYGETESNKRQSNASRVSYRSYYDDRDGGRKEHDNHERLRGGYIYDDVLLESRGEAESVLSAMDDLIDEYGVVSVADLYDLVGLNGSYTDNKYGWTSIRNSEPVRTKGGYLLKLPKPKPLNDD